jgi:hypothetical protein
VCGEATAAPDNGSARLEAMRPIHLGRALGIGVRLASNKILPPAPMAPTPAQQVEQQRRAGVASEQRVQKAAEMGRKARRVGREGRRLGASVWNPFAHASSILWLEVTGLFFAMFAVLFAQHAWVLRRAWRDNTTALATLAHDHQHFLLYCALAALFLYFTTSSFVRASARSRRRRRGL